MEYLLKSRIYGELKWKYIEKKIKPFVLLGIVVWIVYMWQLTNAYPLLVNPIIIQL